MCRDEVGVEGDGLGQVLEDELVSGDDYVVAGHGVPGERGTRELLHESVAEGEELVGPPDLDAASDVEEEGGLVVGVVGEDVGGEVETGSRVEVAEALFRATAEDVQVGGEGLSHATHVTRRAKICRRFTRRGGRVLGAVDEFLLVEVPHQLLLFHRALFAEGQRGYQRALLLGAERVEVAEFLQGLLAEHVRRERGLEAADGGVYVSQPLVGQTLKQHGGALHVA